MNEIERAIGGRAMMDNLLPCPFCGGEATISDGGYSGEKFLARCRELSCPAASGFIRKTHDEAIAAWNRRAELENKPLTLDELKQMDGEPIWVVTLDGTDEPRWEIVVSAGKCGIDLICVLNGVETRDYADFDLYNYTWLAYRNKPKEVEHEAD